jgi:Phage integrase family
MGMIVASAPVRSRPHDAQSQTAASGGLQSTEATHGHHGTRARSSGQGRHCDRGMSGPFGPSCTLGCVYAMRVDDVAPHGYAIDRANVRQRKTGRPVRFELTEQTRESLDAYLRSSGRKPGQVLFPGRGGSDRSLTTRQYARLVGRWVASVGLDPRKFATHSMRRTKATLIYRRTGNLRAVQLLLGHTRIDYVPRRTMSRHAVFVVLLSM